MKNFQKHILVNGIQRSGGSLLARIFDDHPDISSMPFELRYNKFKNVAPNFGVLKGMQNKKEFIENFFEINFKKLNKNFFSKDLSHQYKIDSNYKIFKKNFYKNNNFQNKKIHSIIEKIINFFFINALKGREKKIFLNHLSMSCFSNMNNYFNSLPNILILHPIRDPFTWLQSVKSHFKLSKKLNEDELRYFLSYWHYSNLLAFFGEEKFKKKYFVLTYFDLVSNTEKILKKISRLIKIPFNKSMLTPTLNGKRWLSNSKITVDYKITNYSYLNGFYKMSYSEKKPIEKFLIANNLPIKLNFYKSKYSFLKTYKKYILNNYKHYDYEDIYLEINSMLNLLSFKIISKEKKNLFNILQKTFV